LLDAALAQGRAILSAHRSELDTLAQGLMLYETLSGEDIEGLLAGRAPTREAAVAVAPAPLV
jgi:cell division protease FtsH